MNLLDLHAVTDLPVENSQITHHLQRFADGEIAAIDDLMASASGRLQQLAGRMLSRFAGVGRWERTDDVLQNAMVRLLRALNDMKPRTGVEFLSLAALQIRRELLDLARHYFGPQGHGAHHASWPGGDHDRPTLIQPDVATEPSQLAEWRDLHERVDELPDDLRQVVSLLYYHGLTQVETADVLNINVRTVQRRWQAALLELHRILKDGRPADA